MNILIKDSGLKKKHIAFLMGIHINTLSNWCREVTYPNLKQAQKLKEILKVKHIDDFFASKSQNGGAYIVKDK